jgi:hypothetical protein
LDQGGERPSGAIDVYRAAATSAGAMTGRTRVALPLFDDSLAHRKMIPWTGSKIIAVLLTACLLCVTAIAPAQSVYNLTGLPLYPNLSRAKMDGAAKTDALGHWCSRLAAETFDRLDVVQGWYRKALVNASETDLSHDERYKSLIMLSGIKLALGIDYVTIYRIANQTTTSIELYRCSPAA